MLIDAFMENFVQRFPDVEKTLLTARSEMNEGKAGDDLILRLSLAEIENLIEQVVPFTHEGDSDEDEAFRSQLGESLETMTEQLFLAQFAHTLPEVVADFRKDLVRLMRDEPLTAGLFMPLLPLLKVEAATHLSVSKKFGSLRDAARMIADDHEDELPYDALRVLDEIRDFGICMDLVEGPRAIAPPPAANDNGVAAALTPEV